jgi:D-glycero-beta-D-manno-heptose-7-phosphate kinase
LDRTRLQSLLEGFAGRSVVVAGDCMLDEYIWGRPSRISPEAPVMVIEQERTTYAAGGASNVAVNLVAMEARASMVAVVGLDMMAERLCRELERQGVAHAGVITLADRPTTVKTRIIAQHQQVVRVDRERCGPVPEREQAELLEQLESALDAAEALLFSDYSKGVLTESLVSAAVRSARDRGRLVVANPKPASAAFYREIDLVSVNQSEAEAITGVPVRDDASLASAGERLLALTRCRAAFMTRGGQGIALFEPGSPPYLVAGLALEVYDVAGAGDSVIAAATLARLAGASWAEAATVANFAGNAKVRKLGVAPVTRAEIDSIWAHAHLDQRD